MERAALAALPRATGGILMGRWQSATILDVGAVVGPGPTTAHGSDDVARDWQENGMERLSEASDRALEYAGAWHTRPGRRGSSMGEELARKRLLNDARAGVPRPVLVIATVHEDGNFDPVPYVVLRDETLVRAKLEWTQAAVITWF